MQLSSSAQLVGESAVRILQPGLGAERRRPLAVVEVGRVAHQPGEEQAGAHVLEQVGLRVERLVLLTRASRTSSVESTEAAELVTVAEAVAAGGGEASPTTIVVEPSGGTDSARPLKRASVDLLLGSETAERMQERLCGASPGSCALGRAEAGQGP